MNIYLAIITTVLVVTQIIRVCQNHRQLRRQRIMFEKQIGQLAECEPTKEDFEVQRKAYRLMVKYLESKMKIDTKCIENEVSNAEFAKNPQNGSPNSLFDAVSNIDWSVEE